MGLVSVVIPSLNDAEQMEACLRHLQPFRKMGLQVVVVDGGSLDNSFMIGELLADRCVLSHVGRAKQMNVGAALAGGDVVCFLHADTRLPSDFLEVVGGIKADYFWGRFDVRLSGEHWAFRIIETAMNVRSRLSGVATGDQAMFMSKKLYDRVGGFAEVVLMEDVSMSKKLRRVVAPLCCRQTVVTSSRRWEKRGILQTVLTMWLLRLGYFFRVDMAWLAKLYE